MWVGNIKKIEEWRHQAHISPETPKKSWQTYQNSLTGISEDRQKAYATKKTFNKEKGQQDIVREFCGF